MHCINFDEKFQEYTAHWIADNAAKYNNNYDRMEEKMPEVYLLWLNEPADWLGGETPGSFFAQYEDAAMLVEWMRAYVLARIPVPDQLMERITGMGAAGQEALYALLLDDSAPDEARLTAITLLSEMESTLPAAQYIQWIAARDAQDERADLAAEALAAMGRAIVPKILDAVEHATESGRETFVDVLCNFPGEEAIFSLALAMFAAHPEKRALYASLLGKLGDERAIDPLFSAINDPELNYLDYIELRNALEALGAEVAVERAFDGDPYYESLRRME